MSATPTTDLTIKPMREAAFCPSSWARCRLLIALAGFIIGIMSFQEEDRHYVLSRIGVLLNFAIMLLWGSMYLIGI